MSDEKKLIHEGRCELEITKPGGQPESFVSAPRRIEALTSGQIVITRNHDSVVDQVITVLPTGTKLVVRPK